MKTRFLLFTGYGLILFFFCSLSAKGQVEKFQAAYLYNFTRYIDWPSGDLSNSFVIGIMGNKSLETELETLTSNKKVLGKSIDIKTVSSVEEAKGCQILFVGSSSGNKLMQFNQALSNTSTLVVTEGNSGIKNGAALSFILNENRLQFEIKKGILESRGLKVSTELLSLASKTY